MLHPRQVRQLVVLAFALILCGVLLTTAPYLLALMRGVMWGAAAPVPAPAVTTAPPPPPSPLPPGAVILDGALKDLADLTSIHEVYHEPAYRKVVQNVSMVTEEALASRAEKGVVYATFLKYAPELRGRIFHVAGESMQDFLPVRLADPVAGREDLYRVFMWDDGIEAGFVIDLVDRPGESLEKRDRIEMDGMFYKIVRYQNQHGEDRDVPLFVARSVHRLPPIPEVGKGTGQYIFEVVLGVGIVAVLTGAYLMTRKMAAHRSPTSLRRPDTPPADRKGPGPDSPPKG